VRITCGGLVLWTFPPFSNKDMTVKSTKGKTKWAFSKSLLVRQRPFFSFFSWMIASAQILALEMQEIKKRVSFVVDSANIRWCNTGPKVPSRLDWYTAGTRHVETCHLGLNVLGYIPPLGLLYKWLHDLSGIHVHLKTLGGSVPTGPLRPLSQEENETDGFLKTWCQRRSHAGWTEL